MNREFAATSHAPDQIDGVIQSYELAFKMQDRVPELLDISKESPKVLEEYGVKAGASRKLCKSAVR